MAVDPTHVPPDDPAVQVVVRAHRRALWVIRDDPGTALRHIRTFLGGQTAQEARAHYETFIAPYFTDAGQADLAVGGSAITAVAAELGVPVSVTRHRGRDVPHRDGRVRLRRPGVRLTRQPARGRAQLPGRRSPGTRRSCWG
ncbi:hypothetical protein [Streptomyces sp.]|uniref:hypothetical protein n=1 Tax=Streptomyces sp. TaxID=1931 RepID=UPI0025DF60D9|nr:hypothetical protein [Streptomyces sp.]